MNRFLSEMKTAIALIVVVILAVPAFILIGIGWVAVTIALGLARIVDEIRKEEN